MNNSTEATTEATTEQLRRLHDDYVWDVNSALQDDREDLVRDLSDAYAEDARLVRAGDPRGGR